MDDRFVNPYTFVPLPKGGAKRSDCTEATEPVFSGEIKCRLITKTQIAVPDILKNRSGQCGKNRAEEIRLLHA